MPDASCDWRAEVRARMTRAGIDTHAAASVVEELAIHLEDSHAELVARGESSATARDRLLSPLDDATLRELTRRGRRSTGRSTVGAPATPSSRGRLRWIADLRDDLRYGFRTLRNAPGFTAVAVLTLGLGIGATTTMYTVVDAVLVRDLPFADPTRLVRVVRLRPATSGGEGNVSNAEFLTLRDAARSFASLATYSTFDDGLTYVGRDRPERVYGAAVSGDFFATLGVAPLLGRGFERRDDAPEAPQQVVISYAFWRERLGAARDVLGRTISLQGAAVPIVGVMPPGFWFPRGDRAAFWLNYRIASPSCDCGFTKRVVGRLAPGFTPRQVQSELDGLAATVRERYPGGPAKWTLVARPLGDTLVAGVKPVLLLAMAAVALVLLVACVNVVNLLLARASSREAELAMRVALGASGRRLIRQLLAESALLALAGTVLGVVVARAGLAALLVAMPSSATIVQDAGVAVNGRVLAMVVACAVACSVAIGLVPAISAARSDPLAVMRGGRGATAGRRRRRVRDSLVIAEFAISLVLVIVAGLMIRSLAKLRHVDDGVHDEGVLTASIGLPRTRYATIPSLVSFSDRVLGGLRAIPGVERAAITDGLPPDRAGDVANFKPDGLVLGPGAWEPMAAHVTVSDDYFATLGIPLLDGRTFDARDRDTAQLSAVVSRSLAGRYFHDRSPIGHRIRVNGDTWVTVIGVVGDAKYEGLAGTNGFAIYQSFAQQPQWSFYVVTRMHGDPFTVAMPLRRAVASVDPQIAVAQVHTAGELVDASTAASRFRAQLLTLLAGAALLLAAIGIYGVMSYAVSTRVQEIGVRVALGARSADVTALVLREGIARAAIGVAIGLSAAWATTRLLSTLVFGVTTTDPVTFAGVPAVLLMVAAVACWIPAHRAGRVDPMIALRDGG